MNRIFLTVTICISIFASNVFACGGQDLGDVEVAALANVKAAQEKMAAVYGKPVVIESIVRSGNDILNLDKQATISAMCAANYINVYLTSEESSELLCKTTFQIDNLGEADFSGLIKGLLCRTANDAKPDFIKMD